MTGWPPPRTEPCRGAPGGLPGVGGGDGRGPHGGGHARVLLRRTTAPPRAKVSPPQTRRLFAELWDAGPLTIGERRIKDKDTPATS